MYNTFSKVARSLRAKGLGKIPGMPKAFSLFDRILVPSNPRKIIPVLGFSMVVDVRDKGDVTTSLIEERCYHPRMTIKVQDMVGPGMTCVDVGANIGYFSRVMELRGANVWAFEPSPRNFNLLTSNVLRTICVNLAVSDRYGEVILYEDNFNYGGSSLVRKPKLCTKLKVPCALLDSYFLGYKRIDLVKIDVEGAENQVLKGMRNLIKNNPGMILIIEKLPGYELDLEGLEVIDEIHDRGQVGVNVVARAT